MYGWTRCFSWPRQAVGTMLSVKSRRVGGGYLLVDLFKDILGSQMTGLWVQGHCCVMDSTPFGGQVRVLHSLLFFICLISSWTCFSDMFLKKIYFYVCECFT